jgi:hypothetical protein
MAVLSSTSPNIVDVTKELGPDGKLARTANLLTQTNDLAKMLPITKANNNTHHRTNVVTELGTASERGYNEGIVPTWSKTAQQDFQIAMIGMWAKSDVKVAQASGSPEEFRSRDIKRKWEAITQRWQYLSFYGNHASDQKQFTGLANMAAYQTIGQQVIDCGGTTASVQSSMWLLDAGTESVYYVAPQHSQTFGIQHTNHGIQVAQNQNGTTDAHMAAYVDELALDVGIVVEDQRKVVRLANIEVSHFTALTSTQATTSMSNIIHKMVLGIGRLPRDTMGDRFFICDRTVYTGLFRLGMEKSVSGLGIREALNQFGKIQDVLYFQSYPVLISDQIINTEAVVS